MIRKEIFSLIEKYYSSKSPSFVRGKSKVGVGMPVYDHREVNLVLSTLLDGWITMGKHTDLFERKMAGMFSQKYGVSTNSGSSANLLVMKSLSKIFKQGSLVATSALNYPTTITPIYDAGFKPLFVDCDKFSLNISVNALESAFKKFDVKILFLPHMFGNPCDMNKIMGLCDEHGVFLVEDAAESHGARYDGRLVGSFGDVSTFSFFISHILTTGEGGMVLTRDNRIAELSRSLRAFGRLCSCEVCPPNINPEALCTKRFSNPGIEGYDRRYVYDNSGFSLKLTEMQGAFGVVQLDKLDEFVKIRRSNAHFFSNSFKKFAHLINLPFETRNGLHSYYSYTLSLKEDVGFSRGDFTSFLEKNKIETRPLMGGNITKQPFMKNKDFNVFGKLSNSDFLMSNGFFIGCHPGLSSEALVYVRDLFNEFLEKY
ncbi:MAG: hypothetical protein GON13_01015 [Nanoarchaeota archaeon]|nr:hypothetical protein [Nanoarchaeota archaeon]